jgi:hypothetical protein
MRAPLCAVLAYDILQPAITGCNSFLAAAAAIARAYPRHCEACRGIRVFAVMLVMTTRPDASRCAPRRAAALRDRALDHAIVDDDVTADDEVAQTRAAGRRHRPEQRIVQAKIARRRQLENGAVDEREPVIPAARRRGLKRTPAQYLAENLVVTCSGNFSAPAFLCTVMALGIDNLLFSVDWPYEPNVAAVDFLKRQPLEQHDIEKVAHLNAERVLRL